MGKQFMLRPEFMRFLSGQIFDASALAAACSGVSLPLQSPIRVIHEIRG
jgi:hypothetical protein